MINFKPINNHILIKLPEISKTTESGIFKSELMIKEEEKKMDSFVTVVAIADDITNIKENDKLLLAISHITTVVIEEIKYGIIHISSVMGVKK